MQSPGSRGPDKGRWAAQLRSVGFIAALLTGSSLLMGQTGGIGGRVINSKGAALPQATVSITDSRGHTLASAITDVKGKYQLSLPQGGPDRARASCDGYQPVTRENLRIGGAPLQMNFRLQPQAAGASLGAVQFYKNPAFQTGRLTDPSAGGGYSDQASSVESRLIGQYLSPSGDSDRTASATSSEQADIETGSALLAKRNYSKATSFYQIALRRHPRSARLAAGLGISLYGQGQYSAAVDALSNSARFDPVQPSTYVFIAEAMQLMPRPDPEASALVRDFALRHPDIAEGHYALALDRWKSFRLRHDARLLPTVQAELEDAIQLKPSLKMAHFQLGLVFDEEKRTGRAIQEYAAAARLDPAMRSAHYRLAQDEERVGSKEAAAKELKIYESLRPAMHDE